jgi:hypothetical protein
MDWLGWDGLQMEQHPLNKVFRGAFGPGYIPLPKKELGSFHVFHSHDDRQLGMVYPTPFPVDVRLHGHEPGVS